VCKLLRYAFLQFRFAPYAMRYALCVVCLFRYAILKLQETSPDRTDSASSKNVIPAEAGIHFSMNSINSINAFCTLCY